MNVRDFAGFLVAIATIATVATIVNHNAAGTITNVGKLAQATINASFGK